LTPPKLDDDESDDGTKNLGCMMSFEGGRCIDGSDTENCIY